MGKGERCPLPSQLRGLEERRRPYDAPPDPLVGWGGEAPPASTTKVIRLK